MQKSVCMYELRSSFIEIACHRRLSGPWSKHTNKYMDFLYRSYQWAFFYMLYYLHFHIPRVYYLIDAMISWMHRDTVGFITFCLCSVQFFFSYYFLYILLMLLIFLCRCNFKANCVHSFLYLILDSIYIFFVLLFFALLT